MNENIYQRVASVSKHEPRVGAIERIIELHDVYVQRDGNYLAQGPTWNVDRWADLVDESWKLPKAISRQFICDGFSSLKDENHARSLFVATMIWGYGNVGYGSTRVNSMMIDALKRPGELGSFMSDLQVSAAQSETGAYQFLAKYENRLSQLGPSFASKLSYFVTPNHKSPILDSLVASWITRYEGKKLFDPNKWSTEQYLAYQQYCEALTKGLAYRSGVPEPTRGLIEHLMFVDQSLRNAPVWAKSI